MTSQSDSDFQQKTFPKKYPVPLKNLQNTSGFVIQKRSMGLARPTKRAKNHRGIWLGIGFERLRLRHSRDDRFTQNAISREQGWGVKSGEW